MLDETYIKVKGIWKYLCRAGDKDGKIVDFLLMAKRDMSAAKRFFDKPIAANGKPDKITTDKRGANKAAIDAINAYRDVPILSPSRRSTRLRPADPFYHPFATRLRLGIEVDIAQACGVLPYYLVFPSSLTSNYGAQDYRFDLTSSGDRIQERTFLSAATSHQSYCART